MHVAVVRLAQEELLPLVCGAEDYVLQLAEQEFGATLYCRGGAVSAEAKHAEDAERAAAFIKAVYDAVLQKKKPPSGAELQAMLSGLKSQGGPSLEGASSSPGFLQDLSVRTEKGEIFPCTPCQRAYIEAVFKNDLTFAVGPAGTGKTFLAVAAGVSLFRQRKYDKLILCRPAVEAGGEKIGFLPGDIRDKIDPYMQPLYDALREMTPQDQLARWFERRSVEITPLAFMRGRTLKNAFIILDEAQNAAPVQMKMFLTRLGEGSKMVICGDETQMDLPAGTKSGLTEAMRLTRDMTGVAQVRFKSGDVIRHPLVRRIVEAYERDYAETRLRAENAERPA